MSNRLITAALTEKRSKNGARLLLFVLADRADDQTGVSFYGVETLMERTNLSKSALHGAVRELTELQLLWVEYKKGPKGCNVYHLLLTVQNVDRAESAPCEIQTVQNLEGTVQNVDGTVQNLDRDRADSARNGAESGPNPLEIPKRDTEEEANASTSARSPTPLPFVVAFGESVVEDLCQLYPRKQNPLEAKSAIREALKALLPRFTSFERQGTAAVEFTAAWLRERVGAFATSRQGQPRGGIPHGATWFRQAGYDQDFLAPPATPVTKERGSLEECRAFAEELEQPASDGEAFFYAKEGNGWRNGKNPVRDWRATFRNWKHEGWLASQKQAAAQTGGYANARSQRPATVDMSKPITKF